MYSDLVPAKRRLNSLAALGLLFLLAFALAGCKKSASGGDAEAAAGTKLFESSPPEIKAAWDGALAAIQTNDQAAAYVGLSELRAQSGLTPGQIDAIDAQRRRINTQLAAAAQQGDTNAIEALLQIRNAARSRGR